LKRKAPLKGQNRRGPEDGAAMGGPIPDPKEQQYGFGVYQKIMEKTSIH
jgi:hypothetical protein